jgi:hypothetical protein
MRQIRFSEQEEALLKQGAKHNIGTTGKSNLKQLITETEKAIQ